MIPEHLQERGFQLLFIFLLIFHHPKSPHRTLNPKPLLPYIYLNLHLIRGIRFWGPSPGQPRPNLIPRRGLTLSHEGPSQGQTLSHEGSSQGQTLSHEGPSQGQTLSHEGPSQGQTLSHEGPSQGQTLSHEGPSQGQTLSHEGPSQGQTLSHEGPSQGRTLSHDGPRPYPTKVPPRARPYPTKGPLRARPYPTKGSPRARPMDIGSRVGWAILSRATSAYAMCTLIRAEGRTLRCYVLDLRSGVLCGRVDRVWLREPRITSESDVLHLRSGILCR